MTFELSCTSLIDKFFHFTTTYQSFFLLLFSFQGNVFIASLVSIETLYLSKLELSTLIISTFILPLQH